MTRKRRGLSMTSILVLALVGTITAIVLGAMAVFLQTYQRSLIRSVQTSARQSVAQVGKTVEDYLDDVNSLMELLERKLEDPRQDRDDFFAAFLQIRPDVVAVTTYDAAGGLVDCRSRGAKRTEIYQNLSFDPDKMDDYADGYVSTPHVASIFQGYYPWVVTLVAPLDAPGREEWIALDISFSSISAYLNDVGIGQHGYCFLMDQSGNIIYHPQQQLIYSDLKRENTSLIAGLPDGSNESGSMIYTLTSLENSHWRVVGVSFVEELITESVQEVSRILVASGIGILLAAVIISFVLFRTLSRPMHGLTAAMRQFEQAADNFTYVPVGGAREVRALSDSFGQMVVQIQRLMEQVRAEEVNLRKTELRALQAQINPHFLYNTLDSIAWMCEQGRNAEAVEMVNASASAAATSLSPSAASCSMPRAICRSSPTAIRISFPIPSTCRRSAWTTCATRSRCSPSSKTRSTMASTALWMRGRSASRAARTGTISCSPSRTTAPAWSRSRCRPSCARSAATTPASGSRTSTIV